MHFEAAGNAIARGRWVRLDGSDGLVVSALARWSEKPWAQQLSQGFAARSGRDRECVLGHGEVAHGAVDIAEDTPS